MEPIQESWISYLGLDDPFVIIPVLLILLGGYWFFLQSNPQPRSRPTSPVPSPSRSRVSLAQPKPVGNSQNPEGLQPITFLFGSQTGTAEDFSKKLAKEGKQHKFFTTVVDMEDFELDKLSQEKFIVPVVATYGEGEPTDNAKEFIDWLFDDSRPKDLLAGVKFTVFGLGNKTYEHYNEIARKVDKRLEELGAERIFRRGEGDDDSNLEDDFAAWKTELWPSVCAHFGKEMVEITEDMLNERKYRMIMPAGNIQAPTAKFLSKTSNSSTVYDAKNPYLAKVLVNRELHGPTSDRSCRHIELALPKKMTYEVGDHLGVYPENDKSLAEDVARRLGVDPDVFFTLIPLERGKIPKVGPCTVRQALMQYSDLCSQPRKSVLRVLAQHASDENEKRKLQELSDDKQAQPYTSFIKDDQRTILEVLNEFPSVKVPLDLFLETVPRLAPRYYSISSSIKEHPGQVHITAVVVKFHTSIRREHLGVCSTWLAKIQSGDEIPVYIHKSTFRVPKNPSTPIVMVGPGTGLAPFRGFIHERKPQHSGSKTENVLFFGCRHPEVDFIYRDELEKHHEEGHISLSVAFSRHTDKKVYVQHQIAEVEDQLWDLLSNKNANFYICGDARAMAKDVHQTIVSILRKRASMSEEEAEAYLTNMQKTGRYQTDVWY